MTTSWKKMNRALLSLLLSLSTLLAVSACTEAEKEQMEYKATERKRAAAEKAVRQRAEVSGHRRVEVGHDAQLPAELREAKRATGAEAACRGARRGGAPVDRRDSGGQRRGRRLMLVALAKRAARIVAV